MLGAATCYNTKILPDAETVVIDLLMGASQ